MRAIIISLSVLVGLATAATAQQETLVRQADGGYVTVRTDESGTSINDEKQALKREPISPSETEHWSKVFEFTKDGGKVMSHQNQTSR